MGSKIDKEFDEWLKDYREKHNFFIEDSVKFAQDAWNASRKCQKKKQPKKPLKVKSTEDNEGFDRIINPAFMAKMIPSEILANVLGKNPRPRTEFIKDLWHYVKDNGLQDKENKRMINADEKLFPLFKKDQVSMFDIAKILSNNVTPKD